MAAVNLGDKILVTFYGELLNQRIINTFWYQVSALTGSPNTSTFATALIAQIKTAGGLRDSFVDVAPQNYGLGQIWAQFIEPTRVVKVIDNTADAGNWPVDADTANVAAVITRRGDLAGRKHVGSLHVPISTDPTAIIAGSLSAALKVKTDALATDIASAQVLAGLGTCNPILRNGPLTTDVTVINNAFSQTTVRTMRRRTVGRGI